MAVHWECGETSADKLARIAAHASGEFDHTVKEWDEYTDLREALIWALLVTGFPARSEWAITEKNWQQLYGRLHIMEKVCGCQRVYTPAEGESQRRKVYFVPAEIHSMIGMTVNAGNKSDAEFKKYIWERLQEIPSNNLERFDAGM